MRADLLDRMQCPYCAGRFELDASYRADRGSILSGLVRCPCSRHPILEGILVLRPPVERQYLAELIEAGHADRATHIMMSNRDPMVLRLVVAASHGSRFRRLSLAPAARYLIAEGRRRYEWVRRDVPFSQLLGDSPFENYLTHRFATETLWLAYAVMPLVRARGGVTLELGCGAGHASYLLRSHSNPRELICTDHSFWSLYLAKKYMAPEASFIQLDANLPLPFRSNTIDCILGLDALHYVEAKKTIAEEVKRLLRPKGLLLFLHLHNALQSNPSAGFPLPPQSWIELFRNYSCRARPDRQIVEDLMDRDQLDLRPTSAVQELDAASAISIIASDEPSVFGLYERVREEQFAASQSLHLNTVYRRPKGANDVAVREFPTRSFAAEFPLSAARLPERVNVSQSFEGRIAALSPTGREAALAMFKKFVLVDLPPNYA